VGKDQKPLNKTSDAERLGIKTCSGRGTGRERLIQTRKCFTDEAIELEGRW